MRTIAFTFLTITLCTLELHALRIEAAEVTPEEVEAAIERGKRVVFNNLRLYQSSGEIGYRVMAAMALLNCGVSPKHPELSKTIAEIERNALVLTPDGENDQYDSTYRAGVILMLFEMLNEPRNKATAIRLVGKLQKFQQRNGGWGDTSRTQFALLGLRAAENMGIKVDPQVYLNARKYCEAGQQADGGWAYTWNPGPSYGSMTAAGVTNLFITGAQLYEGRQGCLPGAVDQRLARGLRWLSNNFTVTTNPRHGGYHFYYLYGIERIGIIMAQRTIGGADWYRLGAEYLIRSQSKSGGWTGEVLATEFALLFLGKGRHPVGIQKLQYGKNADWNTDPYDVRYLIEQASKDLEHPMSFQIVDERARPEELAAAPVLYLQGSGDFSFSAPLREHLRSFIQSGGTIVASAICGRTAFVTAFKREAKAVLPDGVFEKLPPDHPIYASRHALQDPSVFMLEGMEMGCRTAIVLAPQDVSCAWGGGSPKADPAVLKGEDVTKLGVNILAYALGFQRLRDKLEKIEITVEKEETIAEPGALTLGKLYHTGGWNPGPAAIPNLGETLRKHTGMHTPVQTQRVTLGTDEPGQHPLLYLTGYRAFSFTPKQLEQLKTYLDNGGFLFADPWCGKTEFDVAFREMCKKLYPNEALERLPLDHKLFRIPFKLEKIDYKHRVPREYPEIQGQPFLEGIHVNGRLAIVYSRFNFGCELQGTTMPESLGIQGADAFKIPINILMYALSQ